MKQPYQHILLAIDLLPDTLHLIQKATEIAREFQAKLELLHVIEPDPAADHIYVNQADYQKQVIAAAEKHFIEITHTFSAISKIHIELGIPKVVILQVGQQLHCDVIIVGSHGKHGLKNLLGSTANAVLHGAHCDVLMISRVD